MAVQVTWLGESGFLLQDDANAVLLDPYFSDALGKRREDRHRLRPAEPAWLEAAYDLVLFTHCHADHTDPETVEQLVRHQPRLMLAGPASSRRILKDMPCFFEIEPGLNLRLGSFRIRALPAIHSDAHAVGYEIVHEGITMYFSGDTALLCDLAERVPHGAEAAFLCFNGGVGKNMNAEDAVMLARRIEAKLVIPFHYGILPGGCEPTEFLALLAKAGIPSFTPVYGEAFSLEAVVKS